MGAVRDAIRWERLAYNSTETLAEFSRLEGRVGGKDDERGVEVKGRVGVKRRERKRRRAACICGLAKLRNVSVRAVAV